MQQDNLESLWNWVKFIFRPQGMIPTFTSSNLQNYKIRSKQDREQATLESNFEQL